MGSKEFKHHYTAQSGPHCEYRLYLWWGEVQPDGRVVDDGWGLAVSKVSANGVELPFADHWEPDFERIHLYFDDYEASGTDWVNLRTGKQVTASEMRAEIASGV
jgi:hypothetical protein